MQNGRERHQSFLPRDEIANLGGAITECVAAVSVANDGVELGDFCFVGDEGVAASDNTGADGRLIKRKLRGVGFGEGGSGGDGRDGRRYAEGASWFLGMRLGA